MHFYLLWFAVYKTATIVGSKSSLCESQLVCLYCASIAA